MKVAVYWNLHKGCWSIQSREGKDYGRVIAHAARVSLEHCQFKVSEAGRQRVLREQKKNVHAFVVGLLVSYDRLDGERVRVAEMGQFKPNLRRVEVFYNPRTMEHFEAKGEGRIYSAPEVYMSETRKVTAWVF